MTESKSPLKNQGLLGAAIAFVGVAISTLLVCKHLFPEFCSQSMGCTVAGGVDGCRELGQSKNSRILDIPIPIAVYGLFYYAFMGALLFRLSRAGATLRNGLVNIVLAGLVFGLVVDLALGYKNFFVLLYPCRLCSYTYLVQLGLVGVGVWIYLANNRDLGSAADLRGALRGTIVPGASAVIISIAAVLVLFVMAGSGRSGAGSDHGHNHGQEAAGIPALAAPDKVKGILEELRFFKKAGLSTAGLTNVEGERTGYIEIHKFADFNCPHCLHASYAMRAALKRWPGRVRIYYRHFPLDGTCNKAVGSKRGGSSCIGATAALCAPVQGIFAPVYHGIFALQEGQKPITTTALQEIVEKNGGNWAKLAACMGSSQTLRALDHDIADAIKIEVESTPTLVLQDHKLPPGTPDMTYLMQMIDALVYEKEGQKAYDEYRRAGGR